MTNPGTGAVLVEQAVKCACETKTYNKARTAVKTNSFQFGGRIDVALQAAEQSAGQNGAASSGSAKRQATRVTNYSGANITSPGAACITACLQ